MSQATTPDAFETLAINPDRFCGGISKIGYQPSAAIMDIVDNSIAAKASRVDIELVLGRDAIANTVGDIESFRIADDGDGMDDARINVALQIGSDVDYPANSLSKFGFGLKSAGFSLGRRIVVYSKHGGRCSAAKRLDRDVLHSCAAICANALPEVFAASPPQRKRDSSPKASLSALVISPGSA